MTAKENKFISIIIAVKNADNAFIKCFNSIRNQTLKSIQVIVIDGGSNKKTIDIINRNLDIIDYYISENDDGIYFAWNKGLAKVNGEWVYFLGADDFLWDKNVLMNVKKSLIKIPRNILIAYGKVFVINSDGSPLYLSGKPWKEVSKLFMQMMSLPHQGVFHRAKLFSEIGNFNVSYKIAGDYELLLRYLNFNNPFFISDLIVAGIRLGGVSNNHKNQLLVLDEFKKARLENGISGFSILWIFALFKVYIRLFLIRLFGHKNLMKLISATNKLRLTLLKKI